MDLSNIFYQRKIAVTARIASFVSWAGRFSAPMGNCGRRLGIPQYYTLPKLESLTICGKVPMRSKTINKFWLRPKIFNRSLKSRILLRPNILLRQYCNIWEIWLHIHCHPGRNRLYFLLRNSDFYWRKTKN